MYVCCESSRYVKLLPCAAKIGRHFIRYVLCKVSEALIRSLIETFTKHDPLGHWSFKAGSYDHYK